MSETIGRFVAERSGEGDTPVESLFHYVRNLHYGNIGIRDPTTVLETGIGSCSGKHVLLQAALERVGYRARVRTAETCFERFVPNDPRLPPDLLAMKAEGCVVDYHNFVEVWLDGRWEWLDATWPDYLKPYGFPVNDSWRPGSRCRIAAPIVALMPVAEDVMGQKRRLLEALPAESRRRRDRFLLLLAEWIADLKLHGPATFGTRV